MSMPKDEAMAETVEAWRTYLKALENSLKILDAQIKEASKMAGVCTDEWCTATEHYIDDLANALFSIHEPHWSNKEDSEKIKKLRRRVHDLYADYRQVYKKVA
jgi:hypothetical protein